MIATEYTLNELMCVLAAREIKDGDVVFVGIGLPNLACNLARATHAPNMTLIYESGAVGAVPDRVPPSIGDPALVTGSLMVTSMADIFQSFLQNGKIQVGFLGGAQVDKRGNINTTVVGPYDAPKVRLPGSGGACEIAIHAQRVLIVTKLDKRAFPEKVDFITSSGFMQKVFSLPYEFIVTRTIGDFQNRLDSLQQIRGFLTGQVVGIALNCVNLIVYSILLFIYNPMALTAAHGDRCSLISRKA